MQAPWHREQQQGAGCRGRRTVALNRRQISAASSSLQGRGRGRTAGPSSQLVAGSWAAGHAQQDGWRAEQPARHAQQRAGTWRPLRPAPCAPHV